MIQNPIPWPNGAKCACAITFDIDADSLIHVARPSDSHHRLYPISMGKYGPDVAVPRILDTYERLGIKQSFFVPAWCIDQYAPVMEKILQGGHEIGHHGLIHEDPIASMGERQREAFEKALSIHERVCGAKPKGYRAPVYNITPQVVDLLIEHGFAYDSSLMGDDIPYLLEKDGNSIAEIPVHWGCDDWPPFAHYEEIGYMMHVQPPSVGYQGFWEEFEAQYEAGGFFMMIVHPFLTGHLARWRVVEKWLENTLEMKDVWFAPLHEIVDYMRGLEARGAYTPRKDVLPYYPEQVNRAEAAE